MKKYIMSLLVLCSSGFIVSTDRNVIYRLPSDTILNKAFQDAGLADFAQNSKLIENLKSHQIYPSEIGSFIQVAYRDYYTYLDSWNPNYTLATPFAMIPVPIFNPLAVIPQSIAVFYRNTLNKMYVVIQNRQRLYQILLQDYPSELLRLKDLGIINSITAPAQQVISYNAWTDPYGLNDDEVQHEQVPLRDDEEAQRLPDSTLYKIGSEDDVKYKLTLPTATQIKEYSDQAGAREMKYIMSYFSTQEKDQNEINKDKNMVNDILLHNRLVQTKMLEKLQKVTIHPTELGSFVEMLYAQDFDDIYNFNISQNSLVGASLNAVSYIPAMNAQGTVIKVNIIQTEWLPTGNQYTLYEMLLKNSPSELLRLEYLGVYNSLHSVAAYL